MIKKIIIFTFISISISSYMMLNAAVSVQGVCITANMPSPFGQPGYQTEMFLESQRFLFSVNIPEKPYYAFYGINNVVTSGYYSLCINGSSDGLCLQRPNLSNINMLTSWSDVVRSAQLSRRTFTILLRDGTNPVLHNALEGDYNYFPTSLKQWTQYSNLAQIWGFHGFVPSAELNYKSEASFGKSGVITRLLLSDSLYNCANPLSRALKAYNVANEMVAEMNINGGVLGTLKNIFDTGYVTQQFLSYEYPLYQKYYTYPVSTANKAFFDNQSYQDYIQKCMNYLKSNINTYGFQGMTKSWAAPTLWSPPLQNYTTVNINSFTQTLPGFSSGESIGNLFFNLVISQDQNTQNALGQLVQGCANYTMVINGKSISQTLGGGVLLYFPLFLTTPGMPYVPMGWNFATQSTVCDQEKLQQLLPDFSLQLNFTLSILAPGS